MSVRPVIDSTLPTVQREACANGTADPCAGFLGNTFESFLDVINPLQHIPLVSNIYRALTGDTMSTGAKLAGGAVYGGPLGFVTALADSIFESATGSDAASMVASLGAPDKTAPGLLAANEVQVASVSSDYDYITRQKLVGASYSRTQNLLA